MSNQRSLAEFQTPGERPVYRVVQWPPVTTYEPAPDIAEPRATLVTEPVVDMLDAASDRLDRRYPLMPHQPEELAVRDTLAALDELRAIVEVQAGQIAALQAALRGAA